MAPPGAVRAHATAHTVDEYGMLADQRADLDDEPPDVEELSEAEHRAAADRLTATNR